jgi:hypothetical protein
MIRVYEDHFEFNGKRVSYNDIEIIKYKENMSTTTNGITTRGKYKAGYTFVLSDGEKIKLKCGRSTLLRDVSDETKHTVDAFVSVIWKTVVKSVAQRACGQIRDGSTLNIAGLSINSSEAKGEKNTLVNADNYGKYKFSVDHIHVISKSGEELFSAKVTVDNADLLPYVLDSLFSTNIDGPKDTGIPEMPKPFFQVYGSLVIFGSILLLIFIVGLIYNILDGDGFFSILRAFIEVLIGVIPVLLITQLIWWIIIKINDWDAASFWIFIY